MNDPVVDMHILVIGFCHSPSYNQISKMENLKPLVKLEVLYIPHNNLDSLGDLSNLKNLKILWLQGNEITKISGLESQ